MGYLVFWRGDDDSAAHFDFIESDSELKRRLREAENEYEDVYVVEVADFELVHTLRRKPTKTFNQSKEKVK